MLASRGLGSLRRGAGNTIWAKVPIGLALALVAVEMARHSWAWRIDVLAAITPSAYTPPGELLRIGAPDRLAGPAVAAGWTITAAALALSVWLMRRSRRTPRRK